MHSPQTRVNLLRCQAVIESAEVSGELRQLALDLVHYLLEMHEGRRLNTPVFLLALDSLELVPGLEESVAQLRATARSGQPPDL